MPDAILALNAGSSSIKCALFEIAPPDGLEAVLHGELEAIGSAPHFRAWDKTGATLAEQRWPDRAAADHEALLSGVLEWVESHLGADRLVAVGHRVVHGGAAYVAPTRLDDAVVRALDRLTPLAPLHQPHSLSPVRAIFAVRPELPQVACFDTAFHSTMPPVATWFALPRAYAAEGVRRYGFHGLSYDYIARQLRQESPALAAGRVVVAHLGNGASLCAMRAGKSIDTTMGFTALDGLAMGTRCGAIDPGVLLYMQQQQGLSVQDVEDILYRKSGLLGVSGISADMRALSASADPAAREAVELFVYRVARETAALTGSLGGLDGLVFTAGIGAHAAHVREAVCARLAWLGVAIDPAANAADAGRIGSAASRVDVRVMQTDEEAMIARHTLETLGSVAPDPRR